MTDEDDAEMAEYWRHKSADEDTKLRELREQAPSAEVPTVSKESTEFVRKPASSLLGEMHNGPRVRQAVSTVGRAYTTLKQKWTTAGEADKKLHEERVKSGYYKKEIAKEERMKLKSLQVQRQYPQVPRPKLQAGVSTAPNLNIMGQERAAAPVSQMWYELSGGTSPENIQALQLQRTLFMELSGMRPATIGSQFTPRRRWQRRRAPAYQSATRPQQSQTSYFAGLSGMGFRSPQPRRQYTPKKHWRKKRWKRRRRR